MIPRLEALATSDQRQTPGLIQLLAPKVGVFRPTIALGALVGPGVTLGTIETLGLTTTIVAPAAARGIVTTVGPQARLRDAKLAVGYRDVLVTVDTNAGVAAGDGTVSSTSATASSNSGNGFCAPTSGRLYLRPGPGKPPFVAVGDTISSGATVCLLEVMKTFHRVTFVGDDLPPRAKITAIEFAEEADVNAGDVLVRFEPA